MPSNHVEKDGEHKGKSRLQLSRKKTHSCAFPTRNSGWKLTPVNQVAALRTSPWRNVAARETAPPAARAGRQDNFITIFTSTTHFSSISSTLSKLSERPGEQKHIHGLG